MPEASTPHPRFNPPQDDLHRLLHPLYGQGPEDLGLERDDQGPEWDLTLELDLDGLPWWWPATRPAEDGPPWSRTERRNVLLRNLREGLPSGFPKTPRTPSEKRAIAQTLRRIYDGLTSGAQGILSSS